MPFFVPNSLVEFEYLGGSNRNLNELEKKYSGVTDFAFFVVNFNYTKKDYDDLTEVEKMFIRKAWENKTVLDTQLINNAFSNALANSMRKKGASAKQLFKPKPKKVEKSNYINQLRRVEALEKDKNWVDKIYQSFRKGGG